MSLSVSPATPGFQDVRPTTVASHLADLRLVDVREPHEFATGRIAGAESVPLATVIEAAAGWDRSRPMLLICRSGNRSGRAAAALAGMGFSNLLNLAGGMLAWEAEGLPVER